MRVRANWQGELTGLWVVLLVFTAAAAAQNAPPREQSNTPGHEYKIAGTVVNAVTGEPLARVKVYLAETRALANRIEAVTREGGHFEFSGLPAGKYSLQGARGGYMTGAYEQHEQYSTAIVTGGQFATDKLFLRLMPLAVIEGHILDESGEPVRGAHVQLYLEDHGGGMSRVRSLGGAQSDDRGYFDFGRLQPGTYFVSVSAKPWYAVHRQEQNGAQLLRVLDVAYPTTYYGGTTEADAAVPVELKGGERAEIEIGLSPVPALHLVFHVADGGGFQVPQLERRVFDSMQPLPPEIQPLGPGLVELTGVPAGRYEVRLASGSSEPEQFTEMNLLQDGQDLSEARGEALASLKVTVRMRGEGALPRQYAVGLRDVRQRIVAALQPGNASDEVSFRGLKPGKYGIVFVAPGKQYAVVGTSSASGVTRGHEVSLASAMAMELTAEVAEGEVEIDGVIEKDGRPTAGVMVALVPNDPESHLDMFRRDQSDFDGTFSLRGVLPGTYTIVAVENAWGFEWLKAGVLARYVKHGQNVNIEEKASGTVHLPEAVQAQAR